MPKSDWDLGQLLIEKGLCTLDQVREALSIQDRMKQMGIVPKRLAEILVEKGYVEPGQAAELGIAAPPPRTAPRLAPRSPAKRYSLTPYAGFAALLALAGVGTWLGSAMLVSGEKGTSVERPPDPRPVSGDAPEKASEEELENIGAFARSSADLENAPEVAKRYADYMQRHAGRKWELEAQSRLKAYRGQADRFARPALEEIQRREPELVEQRRLAELASLYSKFPRNFLEVTDSGKTVKGRLAEVLLQAREAWLKEKAEAEKLAHAGKFPAALERAKAMELVALPEHRAELAGLRGRFEFEARARGMKRRGEIADEYLKLDGPFRQFLVRREPRPAAALVWKFLFDPRPEDDLPFLRLEGVDYAALGKALEAWDAEAVGAIVDRAATDAATPERVSTAEAALLDLRSATLVALFFRDFDVAYKAAVAGKQELELPSLGRGRFEKREKGTVFVLEGGKVLQADTNPLNDQDMAYVALRAGPEDGSRLERAGFFYYYCCVGQFVRACEHLARAEKLGTRGLRVYVATLLAEVQAELGRSLLTKFGAAESAFGGSQWVAARKLLEEMLEFPDHPYTLEKRPLVEKMLFQIHETLEKEKNLGALYRGKVDQAAGGAVRVTYDFEDRDQLDAFEILTEEGGRKLKGRWRLDRGALESSLEASALRWRTRVKGDVTVEYDLVPLEEPQNLVLDLYYQKGQARHYAVVLGFDWVGKADGDRDNSAEDRFGMPRTCVIKYPVSVDKDRWVRAEQWGNWTSRLVGKPALFWKPARGKSARLKVERAGKAIRLLADGVKVWDGEDDSYTEGDVLFFSDCRCRIDALSITFRP